MMLSIDRNYSLIGSTKQCNGINKPNHSIFALYQTIFIIGFMKGVAKDCSCSCCSEKIFRISSQRLSFIQKLFNDQNKSWVTNKSIILLYNLYLSLATRFLYNYTHYQAISVTIFCKKTVLSDFIKSLLKLM